MLAKRIPTILPPMSLEEAIETTRIHSVAGLLDDSRGLVGTRPFRSPHHTISDAGLIGGGAVPRPGEVSLAHHGVLFLDELPEFQRNVLEVMRQPLEDGAVTISRAATSVTFPARFMLAAAMNPCPCGFFGDSTRECHCSPPQIQRYVSKISGPLIDRIDIHIEVPAVKYKELRGARATEDSALVRERVLRARARQIERFTGEKKVFANAQMPPKLIRKYLRHLRRRREDAGERDYAPGTFRARPRPHLESRAHHRRSRCVGKPRNAPPRRSHPVPHARPHVLGVGTPEKILNTEDTEKRGEERRKPNFSTNSPCPLWHFSVFCVLKLLTIVRLRPTCGEYLPALAVDRAARSEFAIRRARTSAGNKFCCRRPDTRAFLSP